MIVFRKFIPLVCVTALLLSACVGGAANTPIPAATATPAGPVIARIGWGGSPDSLNPGAAVLSEAYTIFALVYDSMYALQLDGSFTLGLAESVTTSADGLVWTYKLRSGVTFHDGQSLTAQDVVFSYNLYKAHEDFPYLNSYTGYFDKIEAPDEATVVLTLSEAIPNIESQLVYLYVLPEHIWKDHAEGAAAAEFENTAMIGTGPFKMVEYKQGQFVHLAANKSHFATPPQIDEVVFQTFENQDALVQGIRAGQVDMVTEMPNTAVKSLKDVANVALAIGAPFAPEIDDVIFNQVAPEDCPTDVGGLCTGHPALRDRTVRLALAHATDKQKLVDIVKLGFATPGLTLIPDGLGLWYNNTLQDYEYNIAVAQKLLDDAGYKDTDNDGIREMPDGTRPLIFRMNWPNDSIDAPRMADMLASMWGEAGVKVELQAVDADALTAQCCPVFDFDVILWGWGSDPDPSLLLGVMTTEQIPTGYSETGYSNARYDALYAQQAVALDKAKRQALVWEMQKIVHEDVVYIIPFYSQSVQAYRTDRFTGWITDAPKLELADATSLVVITPVR